MTKKTKHTTENLRQAEKLKNFEKGNSTRLTESAKLERLAEHARRNEERVNSEKGNT